MGTGGVDEDAISWETGGRRRGGMAAAGRRGGRGPSSQAEAEGPVDGEDSRIEESHVSYLDG